VNVIACRDLTAETNYSIYEEEYTESSYIYYPIFINNETIIFVQSYSDSLETDGLYSFDGINKSLLDPGFIYSKISYNKNYNLLAYRGDSNTVKFYYLDSGEFVTFDGLGDYSHIIKFNKDGNLFSLWQLCHLFLVNLTD
jgi:hypothetical protein